MLCGLLLCGSVEAFAAAPSSPADGNWTMPAGNYASTRFSPLDQINGGNVGRLKVEFTFSTGVNRGQEAAPIVVGNTMYIVTPYPNVLYALDLSKPGAPPKWKYEPHPEAAAQGVACCDVVNRGAVYWQGKVDHQHARRQHHRRRCRTPARNSGRRSSATSTKAKASPWRRWW